MCGNTIWICESRPVHNVNVMLRSISLRLNILILLGFVTLAPGAARCQAPGAIDHKSPAGGRATKFQIVQADFTPKATIPGTFTCDGEDMSPHLAWSDPPAGTKSLTLIVDDPDAPGGTWTHWLVYDLPASLRKLDHNQPKTNELAGGRQGQNDFHKIGYNGPCPPAGKPHRYFFKLFALDTTMNLKSGATREEVDSAMKGHVIAQTEIMGTYGR